MKCLYHVHSEYSLNESACTISDICLRASDLGYDAVVLTDNGIMAGTAEFFHVAEKYNVKPIPGVELNININGNMHGIILFAKDDEGYKGLCKITSEGYKTLTDNIPSVTKETIKDFFGPGKRFHGHVGASSGDVNGILTSGIFSHKKTTDRIDEINEEIILLKKKIISPENKEKDEKEYVLKYLEEIKKDLTKRAGKVFFKKEEMIMRAEGEMRRELESKLEAEKEDSKSAEKELKKVKLKIQKVKKELKEIQIKENENIKISEKINELEQEKESLYHDRFDMSQSVEKEALWFSDIFGRDNFYIELMYHGNKEEADIMPVLMRIAKQNHIKTIISNDSHIIEATTKESTKNQIIKTLKNNTWVPQQENILFYDIKSEDELMSSMIGFIPNDLIEESKENLSNIADECNASLPSGYHYPKFNPDNGMTSDEYLAYKANENIHKLFKNGEWTKEYRDRLDYEIPVIQNSGYSDYTLIISEILEEGRKGRHDGKPGSYIGPGRGSGAGSLTNYLMGITHIDPIKYGLIFERYLNIERISPPDIDSDIATSIRPLLVKYIEKKYSSKNDCIGVCTISTRQRYASRAAVRAAARVISARDYGNAAKLYSVGDRIAKNIPTGPNVTLSQCIDSLRAEFNGETEKEIIDWAELIEGTLSGFGTHAAGMIISDSGDVTDYAPVMNAGTNEEPVWNIQYDKDESESIGLLKLDALGLTTLDVISNTLKRIYDTKGIRIDIDTIPFEKEVFREIYSNGNTVGVFQCESHGMKKMWKQLKPDCIEDIIAGVALYRPGPMDFIPDYIKGKHNPSSVKFIVPQLKPILNNTYGQIVYQEQVMQIFRDLGGFSMGRSDLVRRAMSKKKESVLKAERENFIFGNEKEGIKGCVKNGIDKESAEKIFDLMADFAKYAFNKSHAAAYAIVSYQSAWLKYHYPKEYLIEAMNLEPQDNIPVFINECRKYGFNVIQPDINNSIEGFTEYKENIIFGLGNVKGVKKAASTILKNKGQSYTSFQDFILRSGANKTVTKALIKSGAFDAFCKCKKGLLLAYEEMSKQKERYIVLCGRIEKDEEVFKNKPTKKTEEKIRINKRELESVKNKMDNFFIPDNIPTSNDEELEMEKESMSCYLAHHPLDRFDEIVGNFDPISAFEPGLSFKIIGLVSDCKIFNTKKTGEEMSVFNIEDKTGSVKGICFPKQFVEYRQMISENNILILYGDVKEDKDDDGLFFTVKKIEVPLSEKDPVIFFAENIEDWNKNILPKLDINNEKYGYRAVVYVKDEGKLIKTDIYIGKLPEEEEYCGQFT